VCVVCVGLSDASRQSHYSQLHDACLQVPAGAVTSTDLDAERRYFMSRLNDVVMRLLFHQVQLAAAPRQSKNLCKQHSSDSLLVDIVTVH